MKHRELGRTGFSVSEIGFGAWAIGGTWGPTDDTESLATLHRALDLGVNFFDTADVYGDGHSERLLGRLKRERKEPFFIATKAGRGGEKHDVAAYDRKNLTAWVERSLENLGVETLDLLQLHCPPTDVYYRPEVFGALDDLVAAGKLRFYGVSVERVEEALKAMEYPGVQSVQIIFNLFRQRPAELFFEQAKKKRVGVIVRLPLSSGMLSGKFTAKSEFSSDDHRAFNREGAGFDRGETFSGIDYALGLELVEEVRKLAPDDVPLAELALRWILMFDGVSTTIPGARRVSQLEQNVRAASRPALSPELMQRLAELYRSRIKSQVHHHW
jgi:aryl-alcohol dehydrogenase-like predicted oxidoreductase